MNTAKRLGGGVGVLAAVAVVAACSSTSTSPPHVASAPSHLSAAQNASAAYVAKQQTFITDARNKFSVGSSVSDAELASVADGICAGAKAGMSRSALDQVPAAQGMSISGGGADQAVNLAISDLCPGSGPPAPPAFTTAQQQAITSAQSYVDSGQGFSRAGLLSQLTSSYGEGFSPRLARFALAHIQVNWNRQAVISAKSYLNSGQGFSFSGLVQQLESPYGEQFTPAQAQHGATVAFR